MLIAHEKLTFNQKEDLNSGRLLLIVVGSPSEEAVLRHIVSQWIKPVTVTEGVNSCGRYIKQFWYQPDRKHAFILGQYTSPFFESAAHVAPEWVEEYKNDYPEKQRK